MEANRPKIWEYWTPENPNTEYPSLRYVSDPNPSVYFQRNFIRLQDVNLSYTLNRSLLERIGIKDARIFVSGRNLLTITKWKGLDPETGIGISNTRPVIRSYTMGLNLSF